MCGTVTYGRTMPRGISYRSQVLAELAGMIDAVEVDHPVRVAIDGITAAGKTTLADELGKCLAAGHRSVIRLSMDGYHHPRAHRHRQGRDSADGYYEDAYDFDAFAAQVLVPLGQIGSTTGHGYRPAIIDLATDTPLDLPQQPVPGDAVVIVDGSFLARDEVVALWDLRIWVDTSFAVARQRGATRDADQFGGFDRAAHTFDSRYHAANRRYLSEMNPAATADVVVTNDDPEHPSLRLH
jgi:uridine kinase